MKDSPVLKPKKGTTGPVKASEALEKAHQKKTSDSGPAREHGMTDGAQKYDDTVRGYDMIRVGLISVDKLLFITGTSNHGLNK